VYLVVTNAGIKKGGSVFAPPFNARVLLASTTAQSRQLAPLFLH
jgi:hypothetical protein